MSDRYRLPDRVKEQQARALRERFARYLGPTTARRARQRTHWLVIALAIALVAWWLR